MSATSSAMTECLRLCDRRGLSALFESLTNVGNDVDYLLISDLGRLSRNGCETFAMVDALTQIGVTVYAVDNSIGMSFPASMMKVELNHTLAQYYRRKQGTRLLARLSQLTKSPWRQSSGYYPSDRSG